jgi:hypothetical protein
MCLIIVILNKLYYLANKQIIFKCIYVLIFIIKRCLYIYKNTYFILVVIYLLFINRYVICNKISIKFNDHNLLSTCYII